MMNNVMSLSSILVPFFAGLILLIFLRGEDRHMQLILSVVALAISMLMTVFTIMMHAPPATFCIAWLASAGQMCITFSPSSLVLVLVSSLPLAFFLLLIHKNKHSLNHFGLALVAYSAMQIALSSDHFMLRYVALEFVGLCITSAALLFSSPVKKRWAHTKQVFLNLRIGDLALLVAIFLMYTISRTFNITDNFIDAITAESYIQIILSVCLLIAVWVKLAVWPLDQWRSATASIKSDVLKWMFDVIAPLLGIYLLYRSVPLLALNQPAIFLPVLAFAIIAQMITLVVDIRKAAIHNRQPPASQLASIILVLSSFWVSQKTFWAFMLLWILLKVFHLFYNQIIIRGRLNGTETISLVMMRSFIPLGFSFLVLWVLSASSPLPATVSIALWSMWGLQSCFFVKDWMRSLRLSAAENGTGSVVNASIQMLVQSIKVSLILITGVIVADLIAELVRGGGYRLATTGINLSSLPVFSILFWFALVIGWIFSLLIERIASFHLPFNRLKRSLDAIDRHSRAVTDRGDSDPLDFYEKFSHFFQKSASFIYQHFEKESAEKIGEALKRFFGFLFKTIEGFSSGELWERALQTVVTSSQNLQQMHHGLLRFNLLWLLVFIISISLFVWLGFIRGWV